MAKSVIAVIVEALVLAFGDCGSTAITGDKKLSPVLLQSSVIIKSDKFIVVSINDYSTFGDKHLASIIAVIRLASISIPKLYWYYHSY